MQKRHLGLLLVLLAALCVLPALAQAASVSGTVWLDKTVDGLYQGENGLDKAELTLENREGVVATANTAKDGSFIFDNLAEGEYRLSVTLPKNYVPTVPGLDSALLPAQGEKSATAWFNVSDKTTVNLGASKTDVYIGFISFVDENANGGRMLSEELLRGVTIDLIYSKDGEEYVVASGETGKDGALQLRELSPATYHIAVTLPEHYIVGPKGLKLNTFYNCVNPSENSRGVSDEFTLLKGSLGLGIGAVKTGNAQGVIWLDENMNGRRDGNEAGFTGATVELASDELSLTRTAQISDDGAFLFDQLQPTTYAFKVTLPQGYMFTIPGGESLFTDGYTNTQSSTVIVTAESTSTIQSVGVMPATSLAVRFFSDLNANGARDDGETPFAGASVAVLSGGKTVASAISDENGEALIPTVRGGDVTISVSLPDGAVLTCQGADSVFSTVGAQSDSSIAYTLPDGEQSSVSAGATAPASISGFVYADENNNGTRDTNEPGMAGFTVQAIDASGAVTAQTTSGENGAYTLSNLLPAAHTVRFLLTDPYIAAPYTGQGGVLANAIISQNADSGDTDVCVLAPGQQLTDVLGGVFKAGVVSGHVLLTLDNLSSNQGGLSGVTVSLIDESGAEYSSYTNSVTDENGLFYIKGVLPGTYTVRYDLPDDTLFAATDDRSAMSAPFTSSMGSEIALDAIGAVKTATVAGSVTYLSEPVDAQITLTNDESGEAQTISTLDDGAFTLRLVRPGDYHVKVELPQGYVFSFDTCPLVPAAAENVSAAPLTLSMGQLLDGQTVVAAQPATVSGIFYYDENNTAKRGGDETLIDNFEFSICGADGAELELLKTDAGGAFTTSLLIPGQYFVKAKLDADCIFVDDGAKQEADGSWTIPFTVSDAENKADFEVGVLRFCSLSGSMWSLDGGTDGLSGLTVSLYTAAAPDAPVATAVTDASGAYSFDRLYPDEYFLSAALPAEHMFARASDTQGHESVILGDTEEGAKGRSDVFYLSMGEKRMNADIGIGAKGEIGDFAWLDENGNGMQDIGEKGVPGIVIELYQYDELVASATTDEYGHYFMNNLYPGVYTMKVTMHQELKATKHQEDFPLVNSIMPKDDGETVTVENVTVPSGERDLACDLGFVLRKDGKYPAVMQDIPTTDWSYGGTKNQ